LGVLDRPAAYVIIIVNCTRNSLGKMLEHHSYEGSFQIAAIKEFGAKCIVEFVKN